MEPSPTYAKDHTQQLSRRGHLTPKWLAAPALSTRQRQRTGHAAAEGGVQDERGCAQLRQLVPVDGLAEAGI